MKVLLARKNKKKGNTSETMTDSGNKEFDLFVFGNALLNNCIDQEK